MVPVHIRLTFCKDLIFQIIFRISKCNTKYIWDEGYRKAWILTKVHAKLIQNYFSVLWTTSEKRIVLTQSFPMHPFSTP